MSTTSQSHQTSMPAAATPASLAAAPPKPTAKKLVAKRLATTNDGKTGAAIAKPTQAGTSKTAKSAQADKAATAVKVATSAAKPVTAVKKVTAVAPAAVKTEKPKKAKLIRDSFTIPKAEYLVLDELKLRANKLMNPAKKSELLRAGIKALSAMTDSALLAVLKQVPAIKTGRPAAKV